MKPAVTHSDIHLLPAVTDMIRVMVGHSATARRTLDARFERLRPLVSEPRPHRGWIRAIRDALGMSGPELAARMGIGQSSVVDIERSEAQMTIKLDTLRRAADALDCELIYFLVPRSSLDETVRSQARRKAVEHRHRIAHHSRLEDQELDSHVAAEQLDRFVDDLIDKRGLWSLDR